MPERTIKFFLRDNDEGIVSEALENICEANTLLSGLGFENGGLAAAHAIHNGFTAIHGDIHNMTHGEKVAFAVGVQLMMEGAPREEADRYFEFMQSVGLPTTLEEIHLADVSDENLLKIATLACSEGETLQQMPGSYELVEVVEAIKAADRYARSFRERRERREHSAK